MEELNPIPAQTILDGAVALPQGGFRRSISELARLSAGGTGGRSLAAAKVEAAYISYSTNFNNRLKAVSGIGRMLATVIEDPNIIHTELWTTATPLLREWIGPKVLNKLRAESLTISTSPKEASLEIPKNDVLTDKFNLWQPKIAGLADAFEWGLNDLVIAMLVAGVQGTALGSTYDGQNLIDSDHTALSIGGTAQSNIVTGAFTQTVYDTAWQKLLQILNENGQPVNDPGRKMRLVVGPANRKVARDIVQAQRLANGADNLDRATAELVVTGYLTAGRTINVKGTVITLTGNEWFLIPEGSSAVIVQIKRAPELLSVEDGAYAFLNSKYLYGVETEFGAGYGLWQEIVGGPGS